MGIVKGIHAITIFVGVKITDSDMKLPIIQHTPSTATLMAIAIAIAIATTATVVDKSQSTTTTWNLNPPACMYVKYLPFVHHMRDATKLFFTAIHRHLRQNG